MKVLVISHDPNWLTLMRVILNRLGSDVQIGGDVYEVNIQGDFDGIIFFHISRFHPEGKIQEIIDSFPQAKIVFVKQQFDGSEPPGINKIQIPVTSDLVEDMLAKLG